MDKRLEECTGVLVHVNLVPEQGAGADGRTGAGAAGPGACGSCGSCCPTAPREAAAPQRPAPVPPVGLLGRGLWWHRGHWSSSQHPGCEAARSRRLVAELSGMFFTQVGVTGRWVLQSSAKTFLVRGI